MFTQVLGRLVISRGSDFCISSTKVSKEQIFASFQFPFFKLKLHKPTPTKNYSLRKTRLFELSREYSSLSADQYFLAWLSAHCLPLKSWKTRGAIYVIKPDKCSVGVSFNKLDYVNKIDVILNDSSKFHKIGSVNSRNSTIKIETKLQRNLLSVFKSKRLSKMVYGQIRSAGSQRPRRYGTKGGYPP